MTRRPPRFAQAALERSIPPVIALAGDLLEEYRRGRSRWWYWRQVMTIALRQARGAEVRVAAGLAAAVAVHYVIGYPAAEFINLLNLWLTPRVPGWFLDYDLHLLWAIGFKFLVFHLLGIVVTGVQAPPRRVAALLAFVAYVFLVDFGIATQGYADPADLARFIVWQVPTFAAECTGLLLGGIGFWHPQEGTR
jgi:hypothetical protein